MMKRLTHRTLAILLLLAALPLAPGCRKDAAPAKMPLLFDAQADNLATKANINLAMTGAYETGENFAVYAAFAETSFDRANASTYESFWPGAIECAYDSVDDGWAPTTPYYWPLVGTLTFQAYSPYDLGSTGGTVTHTWAGGCTFTGFQVPAAGSQYDLMYSNRVENCRRSDYTRDGDAYDDDNDRTGHPYNGIDIDFKHALSLIDVHAVSSLGSRSTIEYYIKNVRITGAHDTGTFSQAGESWSSVSGTSSYTILGDTWKKLPSANESETEHPVNSSINMILMPQDLDHNGNTEADDVYIQFDYKKVDTRTEPATVLSSESVSWPIPLTYTLSGESVTGWQKSIKYTYRFVFSDYIEFTASISRWGSTIHGTYLIVQ